MRHRAQKISWGTSLKFATVVVILCVTVALAVTPAFAAATQRVASTPTPATTSEAAPTAPTPTLTPAVHCNPKSPHCTGGTVTPNSPIAGLTGQYSQGKTSVSYCNGRLYVGWTGLDDRVNVAWGSTGGNFTNVVTLNDWAYYTYSTNPSTFTSPTLACWRPTSGAYSDATRLWVFFTGTDKNLYYGYFSGDPNDHTLHVHITVPGQSSVFSPAAIVDSSTGALRLAWRGNTTQFIYIARTDNGVSWYNFNNTSTGVIGGSILAAGGPGFAWYCPPGQSCNPWIAWIGTDPQHLLNVGYWDLNAGVWRVVKTLADFTGLNDDLTLVPNGSTLYMLYAGVGLFTVQVDVSTNGSTWNNNQTAFDCVWGVGGAIAPGNHLWLFWPESTELEIEVNQWN